MSAVSSALNTLGRLNVTYAIEPFFTYRILLNSNCEVCELIIVSFFKWRGQRTARLLKHHPLTVLVDSGSPPIYKISRLIAIGYYTSMWNFAARNFRIEELRDECTKMPLVTKTFARDHIKTPFCSMSSVSGEAITCRHRSRIKMTASRR